MGYAQDATTSRRVVHTVAELQMALADKARGQRISELRKRKRLTQQALAERLEVGYRTVQTWEAGTMPSWAYLEKLAGALGVRPEDVIGDEEPIPDPTQLDRIEAKLDRILAFLGAATPQTEVPQPAGELGRRLAGHHSSAEDPRRPGSPPEEERRRGSA